MSLLASGKPAVTQPVSENPPPTATVTSSITFAPLAPGCPLPPVTLIQEIVPSSAESLLGSEPVPSQSWTPGDGSDGDLSMRIGELLREGKPEQALELVPQIDGALVRYNNLQRISEAYVRLRQLDQAEEVALSIPARYENDTEPPGFYSTPTPRRYALITIARHYINTGQLESALAIVEYMDVHSRLAERFEIARLYQERGELSKAAEILDENLVAYRQMVGTADWPSSPDVSESFHLSFLNRFASGYAASGRVETAAAMAPEVVRIVQGLPAQNVYNLSALISIAEIYWRANQPDQAIATLIYATQQVENLGEESLMKVVVLADIVKAYEIRGECNRALEVLSQAEGIASATEDPYRNFHLVALIGAYSALGQYDSALQTAAAIAPEDLRRQVEQAITCAQANGLN